MLFNKFLKVKLSIILLSAQLIFGVSKAYAAEEIKIIYSIFSRTIEIDSLKTNNSWTKEDLVSLFENTLPNFKHSEEGKNLDQKM